MTDKNIDSIIFDMDGTLWDAVDSYCKIWDTTFEQLGIKADPVGRDTLLWFMGSYLEDIMKGLAPGITNTAELLPALERNEKVMMRTLGGRLYPGVYDTISELSRRYKLFMVSNCGEWGLDNFLDFTKLRPFFTAWLTHGGTRRPKAANILALKEKYGLRRPVYVGDTQGDADQARKAGVEMIYCDYGFGKVDRPDYTIHSITELPAAIKFLDTKED